MSPADKPLATLLSREQVQGRRVSLVCGIRIRRKRMAGSHPTETSRLALGNGRNRATADEERSRTIGRHALPPVAVRARGNASSASGSIGQLKPACCYALAYSS
jgi:hypothetical protein